jgi:hypothetical protein
MSDFQNIQPLEELLRALSSQKGKFPRITGDYFSRYCGIVNELRLNVYPGIDAGLASNSTVPGHYTAHNSEHFDEVVRYAGNLLGLTSNSSDTKLEPYEVYVLLLAIRIHDAGNIFGRDGHEKMCFRVLKDMSGGHGLDDAENKTIARIAEAHGGTTESGDKDTIRQLEAESLVGSSQIRPRLLASITRFADEICESRNRAAGYLAKYAGIPKHNEVFHQYASAITGAGVSAKDRRVTLNFDLTVDQVVRKWGYAIEPGTGAVKEDYLIDEILRRLEKMDLERRYCNGFSRDAYSVDAIRASINIVDKKNYDVIESIGIPPLEDAGYPNDGISLSKELSAYCGEQYGIALTKKMGGQKS